MTFRRRVCPLAALSLVGVVLAPPAAHAADDTFVKDVAPILNRSCVGCHRPGEAAPMSLVGYENVRPWVRAIRLVVVAHYTNSASNRTVTAPSQPGSDMFMPVMQYSVETNTSR
jgi:hypothetical protein